ncbi:hypothetical protein D6D10_08293 [Aureobasidium pullulans]|uniref:Uncharacterized protein n=1 Tax=Aureobasidium pullulans TaxID=5580 RepID=A0A4S9ECM0_AURPU|nr:hypothetical protein D6D10_08293 [Aureobasidium pullulans]
MENFKPKQLSTTRVCTLIRTKIVVWFWGQITCDSNKNILPSEDIMTEEQRQFSQHYPLFGRDALLAPPLFTQQTFSTFNMDLVYTSNLDPFEGFNTEPVPTGH